MSSGEFNGFSIAVGLHDGVQETIDCNIDVGSINRKCVSQLTFF